MRTEKKERSVQMNSIIRAFTLMDILKRRTDESHKLSQSELLKLMKEKGSIIFLVGLTLPRYRLL